MISKRSSPDTETIVEQIIEPSKLLKFDATSIGSSFRLPNKIRVPPSTIPGLSKSTYEVIEQIKNSGVAPLETESRIGRVAPIEKFKHLLSSSKSLPLPANYLTLVKLFRAIDTTIYYAYLRKSLKVLSYIQQSVEQTYQFNCKLPQIQQILTVYPESYTLTWNMFNKDQVLFIDFFSKKLKRTKIVRGFWIVWLWNVSRNY